MECAFGIWDDDPCAATCTDDMYKLPALYDGEWHYLCDSHVLECFPDGNVPPGSFDPGEDFYEDEDEEAFDEDEDGDENPYVD